MTKLMGTFTTWCTSPANSAVLPQPPSAVTKHSRLSPSFVSHSSTLPAKRNSKKHLGFYKHTPALLCFHTVHTSQKALGFLTFIWSFNQPKQTSGLVLHLTVHCWTAVSESFCSLIKGITRKICMLCIVLINSISLKLLHVWILF